MSCPHKFIDDLALEKLNFEPETLIVGTFNPGWDNLGNTAGWFYGRTRNNYFWEVLPKLYGEKSLRQSTPAEWKAFCRRRRIALTDLIANIVDAEPEDFEHVISLKNYRDDLIAKQFAQFSLTDIPAVLAKHPSLQQVYLTRRANPAFWRMRWRPVEQYCRDHGVSCKTLLTPSGGARFAIPKKTEISLSDFIFRQWQSQWHDVAL